MLLISETQPEERLREVYGIAKYIWRRINPGNKDGIGGLLSSFSAAGVNGRHMRGYEHVQLCSFLNYAD